MQKRRKKAMRPLRRHRHKGKTRGPGNGPRAQKIPYRLFARCRRMEFYALGDKVTEGTARPVVSWKHDPALTNGGAL